jgi:hypothetical protein
MIGHYLMTLSKEQEDRVLVSQMAPGEYLKHGGERCLVGVVQDAYMTGPVTAAFRQTFERLHTWPPPYQEAYKAGGLEMSGLMLLVSPGICVELRFDSLCSRYGVERITRLIRNRILSNQARRTLTQPAPEAELVPVMAYGNR